MFRRVKRNFSADILLHFSWKEEIYLFTVYLIWRSLKSISIMVLDMLLVETIPGIYIAKALYSQQKNTTLRITLSVCMSATPPSQGCIKFNNIINMKVALKTLNIWIIYKVIMIGKQWKRVKRFWEHMKTERLTYIKLRP